MACESLSPLLVLLIVLPLATAVCVAFLGARRGPAIRRIALISTLVSLLFSIIVAWNFALARGRSSSTPLTKFVPNMATRVEMVPLQPPGSGTDKEVVRPTVSGIEFYIGLDGLNVWLVVLTSLLMVAAVLSSWSSVHDRVNEYFAWLLVLQMAMVGVFLSFDIILFYVFFELTLVPLFFLIGIWGGPQRQYAARKFFVFTLAGSLITLLGVFAIVLLHYTVGFQVIAPDGIKEVHKELTFSIPRLVELTQAAMNSANSDDVQFWLQVQYWVFVALIVGFSVKVPLFPVHTWLPLAHVEAPTAGSVLLAGVLLKLGSFGFLRLAIPLAPDASLTVGAPLIGGLAVIGIIYGAFCALQQDDIKKMVAYSSVSHMGICMLGLFSLNQVGMAGGYLQMINHGLSTGALFLLVGVLYERYHTRKIIDYGGMAAKHKLLAVTFVFITLSSIGLPGLNGFWGEWYSLAGMFGSQSTTIDGVLLSGLGAVGVVLGAWYMLSLVRDVFFGELREPHHEGHDVPDMNGREIAMLAPIAAACLLIGLVPSLVMKPAEPELLYIAKLTDGARERLKKEASRPPADARSSGTSLALTPPPNPLPETERGSRQSLPPLRFGEGVGGGVVTEGRP